MYSSLMPRKRVAINISLPSQDFKDAVIAWHKKHDGTPSKEVLKLYRRLLKQK